METVQRLDRRPKRKYRIATGAGLVAAVALVAGIGDSPARAAEAVDPPTAVVSEPSPEVTVGLGLSHGAASEFEPPTAAQLDEFVMCMADAGVEVEIIEPSEVGEAGEVGELAVEGSGAGEVTGFSGGFAITASASDDPTLPPLVGDECTGLLGLPPIPEPVAPTPEQIAEFESEQAEVEACLDAAGIDEGSPLRPPVGSSGTIVTVIVDENVPTDAEHDAFNECAPDGFAIALGTTIGFAAATD